MLLDDGDGITPFDGTHITLCSEERRRWERQGYGLGSPSLPVPPYEEFLTGTRLPEQCYAYRQKS